MAEPEGKLIVGISGASGVELGFRLLEILKPTRVETHLVMTKSAELTLSLETKHKARDVKALADHCYSIKDVAAPIASGSFRTLGQIIVPCSIRTMSEIATGVTSNLLTRSADVTLKERRPLLLMVRETPLHLGHLRTMCHLTEIGAIIAPPVPAFYSKPETLEEMSDQMLARALDSLDIEVPQLKRWGQD